MRKLKLTKLSKTLKKKISTAVAKGISKEEFFKANNIKKDATYSADGYFTYQKTQQQKINGDTASESLPENAPEPESSPVNTDTEIQDTGSVNGKSALKNEEVLTQPEVIEEAGLQMENYILRQEIKYLKKINKAKNKLIKALRKSSLFYK